MRAVGASIELPSEFARRPPVKSEFAITHVTAESQLSFPKQLSRFPGKWVLEFSVTIGLIALRDLAGFGITIVHE